jgi:MerR family transcriptional regulator, copper efflux regulator
MNGSSELQIGEIAMHSGVSVDTVRYYERLKLLPRADRSKGGFRIFSIETVERIKFIKQAQEMGFSLNEVKELLSLRNNPNSTGADVRKKAEAKLADIEVKMQNLEAIKVELSGLMANCNGKSSIEDCPIMKSLNSEKGR